MLHFFRKIRRDLLANSQFFKYLKYAVGEIILVVLGILIALYINNQNEIRKEQEKFDLILVEVENELITNLEWGRMSISEFTIIDSLCLSILIDNVKFDDQRKYRETFDRVYLDQITDRSIRKLEQFNRITIQQDSIKNELILLNTRGRLYHDQFNDNLLNLVGNQSKKLKNFDWYKSWYFKIEDDRAMQFYLNDPEFEKMVMDKFEAINNFRRGLCRYDVGGSALYKKIYEYLDNRGIQHSDSLLFQFDPEDYKHYLGKYEPKWSNREDYIDFDSIAVTLEEGKLIWNYRRNGQGFRNEIIPISRNYFRDIHHGFYYLKFDDRGEVAGIRFSNREYIIDMEKIR